MRGRTGAATSPKFCPIVSNVPPLLLYAFLRIQRRRDRLLCHNRWSASRLLVAEEIVDLDWNGANRNFSDDFVGGRWTFQVSLQPWGRRRNKLPSSLGWYTRYVLKCNGDWYDFSQLWCGSGSPSCLIVCCGCYAAVSAWRSPTDKDWEKAKAGLSLLADA